MFKNNFTPSKNVFPVVVGLELQSMGGGSHLVLGLLAFFPAHIRTFRSIEALADALAPDYLEPSRIPATESWDNVGQLPPGMWADLLTAVAERREPTKPQLE